LFKRQYLAVLAVLVSVALWSRPGR